MSLETIIGDGIVVPGRPAFISTAKARSVTILSGWLLSAHHLAICALSKSCPVRIVKEHVNEMIVLPIFLSSESTMRYCNWVLARTSEGGKDSSIATTGLCIVRSRIDSISAKTLQHMRLQIGCCSAVLRVEISTNRAMSFALLGSTLEEMKFSALLVLNQDLGFEESVD